MPATALEKKLEPLGLKFAVPSAAAMRIDLNAQERDMLLLAALSALAASGGAPRVAGFNLPPYDYVAMSYVGSTNNVQTITYKTGGSGGTTVATLTFTYVAAGVADDDQIATITKS